MRAGLSLTAIHGAVAAGGPGGVRAEQITPYMREIYIIQMIKTKIINHCLEVAQNNA